MSLLDKRVERGMDLLDMAKPGWADSIDLEELFMDSPYNCVLGQLYDGYMEGREALFQSGYAHEQSIAYGFTLDEEYNEDGNLSYCWDDLTGAWIAKIRERRDS